MLRPSGEAICMFIILFFFYYFKLHRLVSRELSDMDKHLLAEDGVTIPDLGHSRKRKRTHHQPGSSRDSQVLPEAKEANPVHKESEKKWNEVKKYLDPNPQLRGWDKGRYADKVQSQKCL